jgi:mono/diheme cytochrome c family protein
MADHVHEVAALGPASAAFRLDNQIAVADGTNVTRYDLAITSLAATGGRVAGVGSGAIHLFDATKGMDTSFTLPEAAFAAFDGKGKLIGATRHALYMEDDKGGLAPLVDLPDSEVHGLVGSASGVWVATGTELGLLTDGKFDISKGANLPTDAKLVAASSGDVWALSGGALSRYSATPPGDETLWNQTVQPVFTRVCSSCHLPGGTANIDLSYYGSWVARRELIGQRVIDKKPTPMPPPTSPQMLTMEDIAAIQAWVKSGETKP